MSSIKFYRVGGAVRDALMGRTPKDQDFVAVVEGETDVTSAYHFMRGFLVGKGFSVRTESPEFGTLRATGQLTHAGKVYDGTFDFVLARRDVGGTDGRHPERVEVGTLEDDLRRRDFTMNAIAEDNDGHVIDPFGGLKDIWDQTLRTVGNPLERFREDRLRVLRALRFAIVLDFAFDNNLYSALEHWSVETGITEMLKGVSAQRVYEEIDKMCRHNSGTTLYWLNKFNLMHSLPEQLWFKPTLEKR